MTVAPAQLVATGKTIHAIAGSIFNGAVATFTDSNSKTTPGDFTASINWGDGKPATQGSISKTNGVFTVSGSYIYAAAGNDTVTVTITRLLYPQTATATTAAQVNGQLNVLPTQSLTATIGQQFSGELATIVDAQGGLASDFKATILNWGDGTSSAATVVAVPATTTNSSTSTSSTTGIPSTTIASSTTGTTSTATTYLAVVGTHTYSQGGFDTVQVRITRTSSGQFTVSTSRSRSMDRGRGHSDRRADVVDGVFATATNQQEPTIFGWLNPWFHDPVDLSSCQRRHQRTLGEIQANANGDWSSYVGPLGANRSRCSPS